MKQAATIVEALWHAGFAAYIVGGAVRDHLLGKRPLDVDICTAAVPEEIKAVAKKQGWPTLEVGAAFGTIVVVCGGKNYEVTTFRKEIYGQDSHRPELVTFSQSLEEDLARRDFTVNALCMDRNGQLIDLFGGLEDLREGVLRTVGEASRRFSEDGLRMFRAARFIAKLGFSLDEGILPAIQKNRERVQGLSVERVREEVEKTLTAPFVVKGLSILMDSGLLGASCRGREEGRDYPVDILPEAVPLKGLPQNPRHHSLDVWSHTLHVVEQVPACPVLRWAALLHDIGKGRPGVRGLNRRGELSDHGHEQEGAQLAALILERLKVEKTIARQVVWLVRNHMQVLLAEERQVKRWLRKVAKDFRTAEEFWQGIGHWCALGRADRYAKHLSADASLNPLHQKVRQVLAQLPFYPSQLAIGGKDIAAIVGAGPQVRHLQAVLLERLQAGQLENQRESLMSAVRQWFMRQQKER